MANPATISTIRATYSDVGSNFPVFTSAVTRLSIEYVYNSLNSLTDFLYEITAWNGDAPSDHSAVADTLPVGSRWWSVKANSATALLFILSTTWRTVTSA